MILFTIVKACVSLCHTFLDELIIEEKLHQYTTDFHNKVVPSARLVALLKLVQIHNQFLQFSLKQVFILAAKTLLNSII